MKIWIWDWFHYALNWKFNMIWILCIMMPVPNSCFCERYRIASMVTLANPFLTLGRFASNENGPSKKPAQFKRLPVCRGISFLVFFSHKEQSILCRGRSGTENHLQTISKVCMSSEIELQMLNLIIFWSLYSIKTWTDLTMPIPLKLARSDTSLSWRQMIY